MSEKLSEDGTKNPSEKSSQQKSIAFSSNNSVAKPMLQKPAKATAEETSSGTPKIDKKKSPYGLWIPVWKKKINVEGWLKCTLLQMCISSIIESVGVI